MNRKSLYLILFCWIMTAMPMHAQQPFLRYYNLSSGFPHAQVWDIVQDANGILWFATTGGLVRYDGIEYTVYTKDEGLPGNTIRNLSLDSSGIIWLGTDEGLVRFDGKNFTTITISDNGESLAVWQLIKDRTGRTWITTDRGIYLQDTAPYHHIKISHLPESASFRTAFVDSYGHICLPVVGVSLGNILTVQPTPILFLLYRDHHPHFRPMFLKWLRTPAGAYFLPPTTDSVYWISMRCLTRRALMCALLHDYMIAETDFEAAK
ncbi:MAG TPA: two-component regulator propeller domain-containing protein [bacterium]|nr:two-component regulator propeller domain-containing protein [bacterium]